MMIKRRLKARPESIILEYTDKFAQIESSVCQNLVAIKSRRKRAAKNMVAQAVRMMKPTKIDMKQGAVKEIMLPFLWGMRLM